MLLFCHSSCIVHTYKRLITMTRLVYERYMVRGWWGGGWWCWGVRVVLVCGSMFESKFHWYTVYSLDPVVMYGDARLLSDCLIIHIYTCILYSFTAENTHRYLHSYNTHHLSTYTYAHTHTHTNIDTYTHIHARARTCMCVHTHCHTVFH